MTIVSVLKFNFLNQSRKGSYNTLVTSQPEDTQATNPLISSTEATLSNYNEAQNQSVEGELNKCDVNNHPRTKKCISVRRDLKFVKFVK